MTSGDLAEGGTNDRRYDVTRTFYRAEGGVFVEIRREMHTVEVGAERERWPELADDPFRRCPGARDAAADGLRRVEQPRGGGEQG